MKFTMRTPLFAAVPLVMLQLAASASAAPVWSNALIVDRIEGDSNVTVYFTEATPNPGGCSQGVLRVVSWEASHPAAKNFLAMMLTAKVSGRSVQALVDDSACLWGGWPKLSSMRLL